MLDASVQSEQTCFQKSAEAVFGDTRISQAMSSRPTEKAHRPYVCNQWCGRTGRWEGLLEKVCLEFIVEESGGDGAGRPGEWNEASQKENGPDAADGMKL